MNLMIEKIYNFLDVVSSGVGDTVVEKWLESIMKSYNGDSLDAKDSYVAQLHFPGKLFQDIVWWALQKLYLMKF